jgi:monovalent cation/proton antiporter MnhG/PhaG subunit
VTNAAVDVLLVLGVAAELLCCIGVLVMRSVEDRLHYLAGASTVGPLLILAALLLRESVASQGLEAIAAVGLLFLLNPVVVHATGRIARIERERAEEER